MRYRVVLPVVALLLVATAGAAPVAGAGGGGAAAAGAQAAECSFPVTATDATGTEVTVREEPQRVVVVGASAAQTMWELGAEGKVVGMPVKFYTTYLEGASERPDVTGQYGYANVEQVLELDPDLVLLANIQRNETAQQLRSANVTVYKFRAAATIDDIYRKTRLTGRLVGACEEADETVAWMRDRVETVRETVERAEDRPTILYPQSGGYIVAPGSFVHNVIERAGADNVAANGNFSTAYPQVTEEFILEQNPEWLIATYNPGLDQTAENPKALLPRSDAVNQTRAYENGNVVALDGNYLSQPAPRVVYPLQKLARELHPEAYAAANRTTTTTTTTTTTATSATETTTTASAATTTTTTSPPLAGFGTAALLAALVLLAGAGLRRRA